MLSNRATEVSYSRLAQLGLLTYSLTSQKVRKLHFNKAQTREKRPWYETLELTWLNTDSLVEYSPRYSVTLVYLPDFVDSDGCPVGVESAQHAHTCTGSDARSRCYAVLLWW